MQKVVEYTKDGVLSPLIVLNNEKIKELYRNLLKELQIIFTLDQNTQMIRLNYSLKKIKFLMNFWKKKNY